MGRLRLLGIWSGLFHLKNIDRIFASHIFVYYWDQPVSPKSAICTLEKHKSQKKISQKTYNPPTTNPDNQQHIVENGSRHIKKKNNSGPCGAALHVKRQ